MTSDVDCQRAMRWERALAEPLLPHRTGKVAERTRSAVELAKAMTAMSSPHSPVLSPDRTSGTTCGNPRPAYPSGVQEGTLLAVGLSTAATRRQRANSSC